MGTTVLQLCHEGGRKGKGAAQRTFSEKCRTFLPRRAKRRKERNGGDQEWVVIWNDFLGGEFPHKGLQARVSAAKIYDAVSFSCDKKFGGLSRVS